MSKITFKKRFQARINEREKKSENAFYSCRNEARIWWDGYRTALKEIRRDLLFEETGSNTKNDMMNHGAY